MKKIVMILLVVALAAVMLTGCVSINFSPDGSPFSVMGFNVNNAEFMFGPGPGSLTGRGSVETFTFDVGEITEIRVEMLCNINYYSAPSDTVTFQVQPNLMDYIVIEEVGGVLTVRATRNITFSGTANTPVLTVSTSSLNRIFHAGAGRLTTFDPISGDSFSLDVAGAADGNVKLDVRELNVGLAGAGSFELSGTADDANIDMAGAGRLDAFDLKTQTASINMAGAGIVRISCSESLKVVAGGVGTVEYKGSPTLDITRGGLVSIKQVD